MNEIRTLVLRFASNHVANKFCDLAKAKGYAPAWGRDGDWITVITTHQNKAERSKLVAAWASASVEIIG